MHCHNCKDKDLKDNQGDRLLLVGNPNVGKSVIFGLLTKRYVTVSNYPGTTVEIAKSTANLNKKRYTVIDTPGINNLIPFSEDERVTRDILLNEDGQKVVQVADAKNLRRSLFISLQLVEMGIPFILDLNMNDEAKGRGIHIENQKLQEILGVEVVPTIATQKKGIGQLIKAITDVKKSPFKISYEETIENSVRAVEKLIPEDSNTHISRRSIAIMLLAGDESLKEWVKDHIPKDIMGQIESIRQSLQEEFKQPISYIINQQRLKTADSIVSEVISTARTTKTPWASYIGEISSHPIWGIPFLLLALFITYQFVGKFGAGTLVDLMENVVFGEYINPWSKKILLALIPVPFFQDFLIGEYGLITMALTYSVAIIFPIVGTFFILFGILEDSGYLPRLAIMVNKLFKLIGLNGKAVLPMILGLGCDTMATLTARILDSKRERIIVTLLLALGVPCSAQLGVILGMLGSLSLKVTVLWASIIIAAMLLVGFLASKVIPGDPADFILEIPPIRIPQLSNIMLKTLARIEWYLREAVPLFILGTMLLFIFDKFSLLEYLEEFTSPVVSGILGLPSKATESFIIGFLRRDYGAAGLYALAEKGLMDHTQVLVSLVTITLFVPCVANFFIIIKERGLKTGLLMVAFIFPFALLTGGILNFILRWLNVSL